MKVYIVVQETFDECVNHGIYSTLNGAMNEAQELAEYAGLTQIFETADLIWSDDEEDMEIRIDEHYVIE